MDFLAFLEDLSPDRTERPEWRGCGMRTCSKSGSRTDGIRSFFLLNKKLSEFKIVWSFLWLH